ncbi:MAG: FAD-binding oxidoreductase [Gemmatimonadetes bacterium]|nr:FAD-binding oxidoreductase [Gemmatimonadota bacterium]
MQPDARPRPEAYTVDGVTPSRVERPANVDELCRVLKDAYGAGEASIVWGGGTRIHVGNIPQRYDLAVDLTALDRVVEHEPGDLTAVVEAGMTLAALGSHIGANGLRLPVDPPRPDAATVGGTIASNATGPLRTGFGSVREMILGMKVVQPDGVVTKSGGRVVKNVQGYDLHRLHVGAIGTLGVIAEVAFKLVPFPAGTRTVAAWFDDVEGAAAAAMQVVNGPFLPEALSIYSGPVAAGLIRGLAPRGSGGATHLLLSRLAGATATLRRQTDEVTGAVGTAGALGCEVLGSDDAGPVWDCAAGGQDGACVVARATLKPRDAFEYLAALEKAYARTGPLTLGGTVHAGFGTVVVDWAFADGDSPDEAAARATVEAAYTEARSRAAVAVIERCPLPIKRTLDVYGTLGPELDVMRRLKVQFDPGRNLSPGRFAGRI